MNEERKENSWVRRKTYIETKKRKKKIRERKKREKNTQEGRWVVKYLIGWVDYSIIHFFIIRSYKQ